MENISYTALRQNLSTIMDQVESNREIVNITRKGHEPMVMMSKADFDAMEETLYLLSSQKNAGRLYGSMDQADQGEFVDVNLDD